MHQLSRRSVLGIAAAAAAAPLAAVAPAHAASFVEIKADAWTPVSSQAPTTSYWAGPPFPRQLVRVGRVDNTGVGNIWRSFFRIPLGAAAGLTIDQVAITAFLSQSGIGTGPVHLYHVPDIDPAVPLTWNGTNADATWLTLLDGYPATAPAQIGFVGDLLETLVRDAIARGASHLSFGLRNFSEGTPAYWKGFDPASVKLEIITADATRAG